MSDETEASSVPLADLSEDKAQAGASEDTPSTASEPKIDEHQRAATDLEAVFDVPVNISAVLGRTQIEVSDLLTMDEGDVIELDRKVGEAIDIFVNNRLVARGEVVLVEERLGVTMTEIIKSDRAA